MKDVLDTVFDNYFGDKDEYPPQNKFFLLLLYSPDQAGKVNVPFHGETWLDKALFLLSEALPESELEASPNNFGPHIPMMYAIEEQFLNSGLIKEENNIRSLTDIGKNEARKLWDKISEHERNALKNVKKLVLDMSYNELIAFIYSSYPEGITNSEIVDFYEKHREKAALSLFRRKKVSLAKAAEISGMDLIEFRQKLNKLKIPLFD